MIIADAVPEEECITGKPFSLKQKDFIDNILEVLKVHRSAAYLTYLLKCTPIGVSGTKELVRPCGEYLKEQIRILKPRLIISMGGWATNYLMDKLNIANEDKCYSLKEMHGRSFMSKPTEELPLLYLVPTYNPNSPNDLIKETILKDIETANIMLCGKSFFWNNDLTKVDK